MQASATTKPAQYKRGLNRTATSSLRAAIDEFVASRANTLRMVFFFFKVGKVVTRIVFSSYFVVRTELVGAADDVKLAITKPREKPVGNVTVAVAVDKAADAPVSGPVVVIMSGPFSE